MRNRWAAYLGVVLALGVSTVFADAGYTKSSEAIREHIESTAVVGDTGIRSGAATVRDALARFYEMRHFQTAWENPVHVRAQIAAIRAAETHGLDPRHYHLDDLLRRAPGLSRKSPTADWDDAGLDLLLTESFFRLAHDLSSGCVNPARINPDWNFSANDEKADLVDLLIAALADGRIQERLEAQAPSHPLYRRMKTALAQYRRIAAAGGWPMIPEGPLMAIGGRDERVPQLRARLMRSGDLSIDTDGDPFVLEPALGRAVLRFQERVRVDRGGQSADNEGEAVGEATLAALNVPVEERIRQLRVNLERCRWLFHDQPASFVLVDMAGYRGYLFKDDEIIWRARVQIGDTYRETPSFRSVMKYVVFNPTWTVPTGILKKSVLPKIRKDRAYLEKHHMQVFDRDRRPVDPATVEWERYTASSLPYRIVQSPGPHNAVGRVKFIFPNKQYIYLHDTPYKTKFGSNDRAFSAGCIRIDKPYKLAKRLLDDESDPWTIGRIRELLDTNQPRTVFLPEPMPVLLIYLTVQVDDQGQVFFRRDVYKRDAAVIESLNESPPAPLITEQPQSSG